MCVLNKNIFCQYLLFSVGPLFSESFCCSSCIFLQLDYHTLSLQTLLAALFVPYLHLMSQQWQKRTSVRVLTFSLNIPEPPVALAKGEIGFIVALLDKMSLSNVSVIVSIEVGSICTIHEAMSYSCQKHTALPFIIY